MEGFRQTELHSSTENGKMSVTFWRMNIFRVINVLLPDDATDGVRSRYRCVLVLLLVTLRTLAHKMSTKWSCLVTGCWPVGTQISDRKVAVILFHSVAYCALSNIVLYFRVILSCMWSVYNSV